MVQSIVQGRRLLLAENEFLQAAEMREMLEQAGATIVGPASATEEALKLLSFDSEIDGAILDIALRDQNAYPVADFLLKRGIPFLFVTGYALETIPPKYDSIEVCEKPFQFGHLVEKLQRTLERAPV